MARIVLADWWVVWNFMLNDLSSLFNDLILSSLFFLGIGTKEKQEQEKEGIKKEKNSQNEQWRREH